MLKFSKANAKIEALQKVPELSGFLENKRKVYSLDLLSGWSCPFAKECLSKVHIVDGKKKLIDGKDTKFRCFSASQEVVYPAVYNLRKHNLDCLKACKTSHEMEMLLLNSMPKNVGIVRIHVAGDMFNEKYFIAWLNVADKCEDILFYCYTKSLPYLVKHQKRVAGMANFIVTASYGGSQDELIAKKKLRSAVVVFDEKSAADKGLDIDHNDSHAANPAIKDNSFALLLHGVQPKGSDASEALKKLKGKGSYSKKKKGN